MAGYTVGKHALIGLTRTLARDYGKHGVRVNAVCPGWVQTPMADEEMDEFAAHAGLDSREEAYAAVTADVPLRRPARPAEIASVVRFLGSGESSYITGAVLSPTADRTSWTCRRSPSTTPGCSARWGAAPRRRVLGASEPPNDGRSRRDTRDAAARGRP